MASLPESSPSIIFPVKNTGPAAASPDPRKETQRSRNADGEKDLQVVIHDGTRSFQLTPGGSRLRRSVDAFAGQVIARFPRDRSTVQPHQFAYRSHEEAYLLHARTARYHCGLLRYRLGLGGVPKICEERERTRRSVPQLVRHVRGPMPSLAIQRTSNLWFSRLSSLTATISGPLRPLFGC